MTLERPSVENMNILEVFNKRESLYKVLYRIQVLYSKEDFFYYYKDFYRKEEP